MSIIRLDLKVKLLLSLFLLLAPLATVCKGWDMEPAPADRPDYDYRREPGQFKRNKYGMLDPTPDVISLMYLPKDKYGFVDWMAAINEGLISPKDALPGMQPVKDPPDMPPDILIRSKLDFMPDVLFPHARHNVWLKCSICHPKIFIEKAGGNNLSMIGIWKGQFCGRCHDRVAFPIRNCFKCHSVPRKKN